MKRSLLVLALRVAPLLPASPALACGTHAQSEAPAEYTTRGVIRAIDAGARSVTIQHEDVPGYMPAMTMPFEVEANVNLAGIAIGDRVEFRFQPRGGGRHVVVSIRKL